MSRAQSMTAAVSAALNASFSSNNGVGVTGRGAEERALRAKNEMLERQLQHMKEEAEESRLELEAARKVCVYVYVRACGVCVRTLVFQACALFCAGKTGENVLQENSDIENKIDIDTHGKRTNTSSP